MLRRLTEKLQRRIGLATATVAVAAGLVTVLPAQAQTAPEPILIGVSGPLTGPNAQYGAVWKRGFDLAIEEINGSGGINGRPLQYIFEDSQSDPRQSVAIAQKFVSDPRIVVEVGDFSSPASMAASPIYQRAGLVQLGFTNSHPDFTKGGDYMWSNSISQAEDMPNLANYAARLGLKRVAVLHLNTDWGRTSKDLFVKSIEEKGAKVVAAEGYLADEKDFRSALVRVRDANPDGLILISYYNDGALITRQVRSVGLDQPIVGVGSVYSPKFLELGGDAVEGVHTNSQFFPEDPRPEVQNFVRRFQAKYNAEADAFAARAYDTIILIGETIRQSGPDRKAIQEALGKVKDVPSVIYGKLRFDTTTRRVAGAKSVDLIVKGGKFALWDGSAVPTR
jgi:branched-chain amino acid transport system substrate-binding protein